MIRLDKHALPLKNGCVLTIGNFDGVHLGHQALMNETVSMAKKLSLQSAVWTFADHPLCTLGNTNIKYCLGEADKEALIADLGIVLYYSAAFADYRSLSAESFVTEELIGAFNVKYVVCGYDFRFGNGGNGNSAYLKATLEKHGIGCKILPAVTVGGEPVSSTRLRKIIADGDMSAARALLGKPYGFTLPVLHGRKIGRSLGHPTINQLFPSDRALPAFGVYAVLCDIDGKIYKGVANIGVKPTVTNGNCAPLCETHIFDFEGDLYGKDVKVFLYEQLRTERKFPSLEALKAQIATDAENAKKALSNC